MKKKISKLIVLGLFMFLVTGCSTQLKTSDNKVVKNEITGQTLTKNILCQPSSDETIKMYTETLDKSKTILQEKLTKNEYTPLVSEAEYKRMFMKGVVHNYFENSYKELVSFFAKEQKLSADDLKEIIDMIEKGKE
jgi:predicted transcriptional regulator